MAWAPRGPYTESNSELTGSCSGVFLLLPLISFWYPSPVSKLPPSIASGLWVGSYSSPNPPSVGSCSCRPQSHPVPLRGRPVQPAVIYVCGKLLLPTQQLSAGQIAKVNRWINIIPGYKKRIFYTLWKGESTPCVIPMCMFTFTSIYIYLPFLCSQIAYPKICISRVILHFFDISSLCVFKCLLKLPVSKVIQRHIAMQFNALVTFVWYSPLCVSKCVLKLCSSEDC